PANLLIVRRSTEELIRKLLAEKDDPRADVVWMVAATGMIRLRTEGLLEPLAGLYEPEGLAKIEPGWRDPTLPPEWLGLSGWAPVLCVNRNLVPEQERALLESGSWDALTDRRFRGQIVMPSPYTSGTGYMVVSGLVQMQAYGEPDAWAYMDRLHENVAWYTSSGAEPCRLVAAGQVGIGIGANICSSDPRFQGVLLVYPAPGAGWEMDAVALVRKDRIDQGALDFLAWAIGEQAMGEYATFRPMLAYDGFQPAQPCIAGLQGGEMIPDRFFWASANLERVIEKWQIRYDSLPR
ncbi:MAG TPA: extracellular solute-binding protein, partial [Anaerolineae bacterium]|nr:extracellular solute-binding protein [Anaerolineae bacterium]